MKVRFTSGDPFTKRTVTLELHSEELRQAILAATPSGDVIYLTVDKPHVQYILKVI